jgi:hypothetical protein
MIMPKKSKVFIGHVYKVIAIPVPFLRLDLPILVNVRPSYPFDALAFYPSSFAEKVYFGHSLIGS